jgi:hypothetical protein
LQQCLVRWNKGDKGIALPVCETEGSDDRKGNHDNDGDARTYRPNVPDASNIDVGKKNDDRCLEEIFLDRRQVDDAGDV